MSKYIIVSDMHLRYDTPTCRIDDFKETQIKKLKWLKELQEKYRAIILHSGDLTHKARPENGNELLNDIIFMYLSDMIGVAGNHDLLYHKMENLDKSLLGVIVKAQKYCLVKNSAVYTLNDGDLVSGFNFGEEIRAPRIKAENKTIAIYHGYVSKESGFISGKVAKNILKEFPEYDLIITGDNHETFTEEHEGRYLINPGCFSRQSADKMNHKPCVFLYDSETHKYEQIFIPIENDVFNIEYLDIQKEKDERLNSFIETVNGEYEVGGSFEKNMENYLLKNETCNDVKNIIFECMEG